MTQTTRIRFGRVGSLPVPDGIKPPQLFTLRLHPTPTGPGVITFPPCEKGYEISYCFRSLGNEWHSWQAFDAWEDCEVGTAKLSATGPDGRRYVWEVFFSHDGTPEQEFWGATFQPPTVS